MDPDTIKKYLIDSYLWIYSVEQRMKLIEQCCDALEISRRQFDRYRSALLTDSIELKQLELQAIANILNCQPSDLINTKSIPHEQI